MRIAITGGSGFIGTRLIEELARDGHECVIVDIADQNPVDILHQDKLNTAVAGCEAIYHLAAAHRDDIFPRSIYYEVNGQGTQNVIEAAKANNIKQIIFTSTVAVYGMDKGTPDETAPTDPFNDYGKSKLEAENHLTAWAKENANNIATIIRPVVVFGEKNRGNVHALINQIAKNRFVMIGSGKNKKSMAYVGNVAAFLKFCLNEKAGVKIYNYADKPDFTTNQLIDVIHGHLCKKKPAFSIPYPLGLSAGYVFDGLARVTGKKLPISSIRVQKFCADTSFKADKCEQAGFMPLYTLSEGVQRMINHDFVLTKPEQQEAA